MVMAGQAKKAGGGTVPTNKQALQPVTCLMCVWPWKTSGMLVTPDAALLAASQAGHIMDHTQLLHQMVVASQ